MMIPARSSRTGTEVVANDFPVIARDARCLLMLTSLAIPPK